MIDIPLPILVLQHPQEPSRKDNAISSARLITETVTPAHVAVGLSWKNLKHALSKFKSLHDEDGEIAEGFDQPGNWATLYLGTKQQSTGGESETAEEELNLEPGLYFLDKKGVLKDPDESSQKPIHGLIVLDGTWAQAKTLWWRNAWLLKTQRMFLVPKEKSKYGHLRKEPRPECVSTIEAVAETLSFCGIDASVEEHLKNVFSEQLKTHRTQLKTASSK